MPRKSPKSAIQKLKEQKIRMQRKRESESIKEQERQRENAMKSMQEKRKRETIDECTERLEKVQRTMSKIRRKETPEKRSERMKKDKTTKRVTRQEETLQKRSERLKKVKRAMSETRQEEIPEKRSARVQKDRAAKRTTRQTETPAKRSKRISGVQVAMSRLRMTRKSTIPSITHVINGFLEKVKDSCNYVCCSCDRLMYRLTVRHLDDAQYTKTPKHILNDVLQYRIRSARDSEWICRTCHNCLKRGKMPAQSKANKLSLTDQPSELKDLNNLETRLICKRIPFMKMVGLPRGRQHGIHGPAVNVPSKLDTVCNLFPRLPSESQVIPLKFKRKRVYKSYYMYQYVDPRKVLAALKRLKSDNPHYKDVELNENWENDAEVDNPELWHAMTSNCDECDKATADSDTTVLPNVDNEVPSDTATSSVVPDKMTNVHSTVPVDKVNQNNDTIYTIASCRHMTVIDVPGDGNCMFNSVCYQLKRLGVVSVTQANLRLVLANHMSEHAEWYREFVCARIQLDDTHRCQRADTEQPSKEDRAVERIDDVESRTEVRWIKYLDDLSYGNQWGEHIALQAIADCYSLKITVHQTGQNAPIHVESRNEIKHKFDLGLIGQNHYVIFVPSRDKEVGKTIRHTDGQVSINDDDESAEDLNEEDDHAFENAVATRGLPHESSLINDSAQFENVTLNIAPAENEKPIPLLSDPHFEELSNPDKYPDGTNALTTERDVSITPRKYFNQRLLDRDGRFSQSVEYLLSAQYAVENQQVHSDINHFIYRRCSGKEFQGQRLNAGLIKNSSKLNDMMKADVAFKILKNVRGTPGYFQTLLYDVLAMIRQLGMPTFFLTLSCADMQWPDILQTIAQQYGTILTDEDIVNMSYKEKCDWLRRNPVTAARQFQYRLELFFKDVLRSNARPVGELLHYVIRIEFQARGSPHAHTLLWINNAPKIDKDSDRKVCDFIDKYITCALPDDDGELSDLVTKLQSHSHSSYCRKKGSCRFHFPRPPSAQTILAREPESDELSNQHKERARNTLKPVQEIMTSEDCSDISLHKLLEQAGVTEQQYTAALSVSGKGSNVVLERTPKEQNVNPYNPTLLKAWKANLDIQMILDPWACVAYIANYLTKDETGMGELLKQACKEYQDKDVHSMLRHIGSTFLNRRELSAQEAAYRILSIPLKKLSRKVVFVNTDPENQRVAVLKTKAQLKDVDDADEDVFQSNIVERYSLRPDAIENMCLAEFSANYSINYNESNDTDDSVPAVLEECEDETADARRLAMPKKVKLKDGKTTMRKRRQEAVIRFRKVNRAKEPSLFFRSRLMLYLPWRKEDVDLLGDFDNYSEHYENVIDTVKTNESLYSSDVADLEQAMEHNQQHGVPDHIWAELAPGTEHVEIQDRNEPVEINLDIDDEDLAANASMFENPQCHPTSDIALRYEKEKNQTDLSPKEIRMMMRSLNDKQKQVVMFHRQWCKDAVLDMRKGNPVKPYRLFLSGPGGVGKSHVIKLIHAETRRILRLSRQAKPTDITTLLTAPTGVAAFNISGMTVHSALLLRTSKFGDNTDTLTFEKLNTLRSNLENVQVIVIDEISMVGSDMLLNIHKRLCEIKGNTNDDTLFGNVCVLAVGDLYQLPPVRQSHIYSPYKNAVANLSGSLWKDHFMLHELDEVMRQRGDIDFAELLCRLRTGNSNDGDIEILKSRNIDRTDPAYPLDALHVFAFNADVDEWNAQRLKDIAPDESNRIIIPAVDSKKDSTGLIDLTNLCSQQKRSETAGLHTVLQLAVGARVMLLYNVNVLDGLVNGVIGSVQGMKQNKSGNVVIVFVKFDNKDVGKHAIAVSQWKDEFPEAVPVKRHEGMYDKLGHKSTQVTRVQFPLTLSWAITIHKCQGLTLEKVVVSMKGAKRFGHGQAYVAFSRVKNLCDLYITDFDISGVRVNKKVLPVMEEMRTSPLPSLPVPHMLQLEKPTWLTIGHLNIRYFLEKLSDLCVDGHNLYSHCDIMCFTETYLADDHNIDCFLEKYNYVASRRNVETARHRNTHGLLVCIGERMDTEELVFNVEGLESHVVLIRGQNVRLIVVLVYKPPSLSMTKFIELVESLLQMMPLSVPTVILGDFNDNLYDNPISPLVRMMNYYGFAQYVDKPTTDAGTLLDHIYFNKTTPTAEIQSFVDVCDIYYSDHDAVFLTTKL